MYIKVLVVLLVLRSGMSNHRYKVDVERTYVESWNIEAASIINLCATSNVSGIGWSKCIPDCHNRKGKNMLVHSSLLSQMPLSMLRLQEMSKNVRCEFAHGFGMWMWGRGDERKGLVASSFRCWGVSYNHPFYASISYFKALFKDRNDQVNHQDTFIPIWM